MIVQYIAALAVAGIVELAILKTSISIALKKKGLEFTYGK